MIHFVGAGSGAADLITVRGKMCIRDSLLSICVNKRILLKFCHILPKPKGHKVSLASCVFSFFNGNRMKKCFPQLRIQVCILS